jgi:serine/threonine protein kinase
MELADGGDLSKYLVPQMPEQSILFYFTQIIEGVEYIHSQGIVHRDLKPDNIFIMTNGTIKIGIFGVAKQLSNLNLLQMTSIGTFLYMAPEILFKQPSGISSDIWSLGCILYQMMTGNLPFLANSIPHYF